MILDSKWANREVLGSVGQRRANLQRLCLAKRDTASIYGGAMRKAVLAMMLAVVSSGATAAWLDVGDTEAVTAYVDPATIRKAGNVVTMWDLLDYKKAQEIPSGKTFMSVRAQTEYSCKEKNSRPLTASAHSEKMARGGTVHAVNEPGSWRPVPPGTLDEALWKIACGKQRAL